MITGFLKIVTTQNEYPVDVNVIMGKPFTLKELRQAINQSMQA